MALSNEEVDSFEQNICNHIQSMHFYALFPNGTKVPLAEACNAIMTDQSLRPMKTMGEEGAPPRLVLVIEATVTAEELPYWRQGFYLSTGTSSSMAGTWLPFDGIVLGTNKNPSDGDINGPIGLPDPPSEEQVPREYQLWFDKTKFLARESGMTIEQGSPNAAYLFKDGFLPEPLYGDRLGQFSYAVASYVLGGQFWEKKGPYIGNLFGGRVTNETKALPGFDTLRQSLLPAHPLEPCFNDLISEGFIPFSTVADVNGYLSSQQGISYMNGFLQFGIELPSPLDMSVPAIFEDKVYNLPFILYVNRMRTALHDILIKIRTGLIPGDPASISAAVNEAYQTIGRVRVYQHDEWDIRNYPDNIVFYIDPAQAASQRYALGGRRKRKTRRQRRFNAKKPTQKRRRFLRSV
jgi:hypothetical protein